MPKVKISKKTNIHIKRPMQRKFRIGNRKAGRSAMEMSNEELNKILANQDQKKYHAKAKAVLVQRGVA